MRVLTEPNPEWKKSRLPPSEALEREPRAPSLCPGDWGWKRTSRKGMREGAAPILACWGPPWGVLEKRFPLSRVNSEMGVLWPGSQALVENEAHPALPRGS